MVRFERLEVYETFSAFGVCTLQLHEECRELSARLFEEYGVRGEYVCRRRREPGSKRKLVKVKLVYQLHASFGDLYPICTACRSCAERSNCLRSSFMPDRGEEITAFLSEEACYQGGRAEEKRFRR